MQTFSESTELGGVSGLRGTPERRLSVWGSVRNPDSLLPEVSSVDIQTGMSEWGFTGNLLVQSDYVKTTTPVEQPGLCCLKWWGWNDGVAHDLQALLSVNQNKIFLHLNQYLMKYLKVRQILPWKQRLWCVFSVCISLLPAEFWKQIDVNGRMRSVLCLMPGIFWQETYINTHARE